MPIRSFQGLHPSLGQGVYVAPSAEVIGQVILGDDASIWPFASVRGDMQGITIGARTNIQDGSVLHTTHDSKYFPKGFALTIGNDVTIGHRVILHGCKVNDFCLIGMGSILLDGVIVESDVIVGAGSLVPPGKVLDSGYLWVGSPVVKKRPLKPEEIEFIRYSAKNYVALKDHYLG